MTTAMKLREEGIQEGLKRKAIEDARNMLLDGISIEQAAQYTGLSLDDVKNLKLSLKT